MVSIIGSVIALAVMAVFVFPIVKYFIVTPQAQLREYVQEMDAWGYVAIYLFQVLQVVIAIIPGGVVQFVAGYAYTPWIGFAICMAGVYTGQLIIFRLVRRFGHNLVEAVSGGEKLKKWNFIRNEKKLELLTFILYVIPGSPKDLLCYIFPLSTISEQNFMVISIIARIPAALTSILAAGYIYEKDYVPAATIWGITMLVSGIAIVVGRVITNKRRNKRKD